MINKRFRLDDVCRVLLRLYICVLFAFYEIRLFVEVALAGALLLYFFLRGTKITIYALWSMAFLSICIMSNLWSVSVSASILGARAALETVLIGNLLIAYLDRDEKLGYFVRSYVLAGLVLAARLLIVTPVSVWGTLRVGDATYNPNTMGLQLAISAICALYVANSSRRSRRRYLVGFLLFIPLILLTGSRKALIFVLVGMVLSSLLTRRGMFWKLLVGAVASALVFWAIMSVPALHEVMGSRLEGLLPLLTGQGSPDASTRVRLGMIQRAVQLWKLKPVFGYGIGSFAEVSGYGTYAHNNYLELLVGVGIVGTCIYYTIYLYAIHNLRRSRKIPIGGLFMVILMLLALTEYGLVSWSSEIYQLFIAAAIAVVRLERQSDFSGSTCIQ